MLGQQLARKRLLVGPAGREVADRTLGALGLAEGCGLDLLAGAPDEVTEVQQTHVGAAEEGEHPAVAHQGQEGASEHQPVETGQNGSDERVVAR